MISPDYPQLFATELTRWFEGHQRDLPWRQREVAPDPYRILVSEVMLQQTTVAAAVPFFLRFMQRFPDVASLAAAPEEDVLAHWAGLGYYARARNLQKCAREVVDNWGGTFPGTAPELMTLPGVGRYTAGAVASIAFGERAPIVDANVARVLARVHCLEGDLKKTSNVNRLWSEAERLANVPQIKPEELNPALMELGALICSPKNPSCEICPVRSHCGAHATGRQAALPHVPRKAQPTPVYDACACITAAKDGEKVYLLRRRPDIPRTWWQGMWELPRVTLRADETAAAALERMGTEMGLSLRVGLTLKTLKHSVTRYAVHLDCRAVRLEGEVPNEWIAAGQWGWFTAAEAYGLPLPTSVRRLLGHLEQPPTQLQLL